VSTRHESAEMMGMAVPDRPLSMSDENINLGDKDSIRRRALWALEGKPDASYSRVEIPELMTPDNETKGFDFRQYMSFLRFNVSSCVSSFETLFSGGLWCQPGTVHSHAK
jgi:hypothetical protein